MSKHSLIIGGNTGIGLSIARELLNNGHHVTTMSRSKNELSELGTVTHHHIDVTSDDMQLPIIDHPIDAFVYCPGSINLKPFKNIKPEAFIADMNINFFGLIKTVQFYLQNILKADNPSLLFFSTVAVDTGMPFHTSVAAAKGAVEGFARSLAAELAPSVRVNVIAPSLTQTPMSERLLKNEKQIESSKARHPLKRFGQPEDIAQMASFLLSQSASWITGQVIHVDGGLSSIKTL